MNKQKEKRAIERLQMLAPGKNMPPYYLAYSGGKDSDAILILAELAGVRYEAVHNLTTVDAPETVYYVRSKPNVKIDYPSISMWELIVRKGLPPTRIARYCCQELKEHGGKYRTVITGVRWAESRKRKENSWLISIQGKPKTTQKEAERRGLDYHTNRFGGVILNNDNEENRDMIESCYRHNKVLINPIIDWEDSDVWEFLGHYGCKGNPLYECGFKRIGCIGCPMAGKHRYAEFNRYPKYKANYIRTFDRMLKAREQSGLPPTKWRNGVDVFKWWLEEDPAQLSLFDSEYEEFFAEEFVYGTITDG